MLNMLIVIYACYGLIISYSFTFFSFSFLFSPPPPLPQGKSVWELIHYVVYYSHDTGSLVLNVFM